MGGGSGGFEVQLENPLMAMKGWEVEVRMLKAIPVRPPMEINKLLETANKVILVIKRQRTWLNCVLVESLAGSAG